jgi:hypothetical protein
VAWRGVDNLGAIPLPGGLNLPKQLSGKRKSEYVDLLSTIVQQTACCLHATSGLRDDHVVIIIFVELLDLSNNEYNFDQLRVKNSKEIAEK